MEEKLAGLEEYRKMNPNQLTQEQLAALEWELERPRKRTVSDELVDYRFWRRGLPSRQELFATYLKSILPPGRLRILEVGSGRRARLSVLLHDMGHGVTCMDPKAEPVDEGIEVRREIFHWEKEDLGKFDYVVAQEPCEATEHIVRACSRQRVPFTVALCGVPHELIGGGMPEDVYAWYDCLEEIDPEYTRLEYIQIYPGMDVAVIHSV